MPSGIVRDLRRELDLPDVVCRLLARRGVEEPDAARAYLRPTFGALHPPGALPDVEAAVARLSDALSRDETVLVHGDYDADGVCAAALLVRGLRELGARVEPFVPHRIRDGYDLGEAGLRRAREVGAGLVVTADCGVSAVQAVEAASRDGVDVVVTDHHRPPPRLPPAVAVVDPARDDADYPFEGLSGSGVAFKLLRALWVAEGREPSALNRHLDLVALGTVADVVPLVDENRILVRAGLRALERTRKPGVRALAEEAGLDGELTAEHVGFALGPRLNSAGRVGEAGEALALLLAEDRDEARRLAGRLEGHNRERRTEDRRVQREAEERLGEAYDPERDRGVVVCGEDWHPGVIGIAASRIVERVHRPAVLVSFRGDPGRGSARSVRGFHLHAALSECSDLLERFGGHRMAAGLEIRRANLEAFRRRFDELAARELDGAEPAPELRLDLAVPPGRADRDLHRLLRHFAPFGEDNPRPLLLAEGVGLRGASAVGREGRHLKGVLVDGEGGELAAIGFGLGDRLDEVGGGTRWDVAYELVLDTYRGRRRLQARIRDLRPA